MSNIYAYVLGTIDENKRFHSHKIYSALGTCKDYVNSRRRCWSVARQVCWGIRPIYEPGDKFSPVKYVSLPGGNEQDWYRLDNSKEVIHV